MKERKDEERKDGIRQKKTKDLEELFRKEYGRANKKAREHG